MIKLICANTNVKKIQMEGILLKSFYEASVP
jgi:hypothetical protein